MARQFEILPAYFLVIAFLNQVIIKSTTQILHDFEIVFEIVLQ